jgi:predicted secreted hydrolase
MVYRIRSVDKEHLYASLMHDNGIIETLPSEEINLMVKQTKKGKYPEGFKLKLEKYNIDLEITAINNNQIMRFGIEYFEGMVKFNGTHQGTGFLEMTGY